MQVLIDVVIALQSNFFTISLEYKNANIANFIADIWEYKLALMPLLPTLRACENVEWKPKRLKFTETGTPLKGVQNSLVHLNPAKPSA